MLGAVEHQAHRILHTFSPIQGSNVPFGTVGNPSPNPSLTCPGTQNVAYSLFGSVVVEVVVVDVVVGIESRGFFVGMKETIHPF